MQFNTWVRRVAPRQIVMPLLACLFCLVVFWAPGVNAGAGGERLGPTVREVVEFTTLVQPRSGGDEELQAQRSPDGERAFIVTRQADVATDQNRFDILLLDLSPQRLARGGYEEPQRLLRVEDTQDQAYLFPSIRQARWVGNDSIVFLARLNQTPLQVYRLDIGSRRVTQLTQAKGLIVSYDVSDDMRHVVYVAQLPNPALPEGAHHVVVDNQSFWSVKFGHMRLGPQMRRHQFFVAEAGSPGPGRALGEPFESSPYAPSPSISPDGRWVLVPRYEPERQRAWAERYPFVADATARFSRSLQLDPQRYFSRPTAYVPRRLVAYRVADGSEQAVLDAPDDAITNAAQWRQDRLWQGGGTSVVLAGTHLPLVAGAGDGDLSRRPHIVEYWPDARRWKVIAALDQGLRAAYADPARAGAFVAQDGDRRRRFERSEDGGWREVDVRSGSEELLAPERVEPPAWRLAVEQGLNQPADVVALGPKGARVAMTRLNPQFDADRWGVMRPFGWTDAKGRRWHGGLMSASGARVGGPQPLVIQTYRFVSDGFYLDGPGAGFSSGFAGRAFLREGLLVLALPWGPSPDMPSSPRGGVQDFMDGVQGAVDELVRQGLVDPQRVGILGWSATGERVLNLVTFAKTPIRAASLLDGDANTLFSATVTYGAGDAMSTRRELVNQSQPFGSSLAQWVRSDPSLHTDCVRAALRIETYGPTVLNNWDIYALLRRQHKAAEMVVIPEGTHSLSRPSERMISLQGNVDWYRFWLKGEERTEVLLPGESSQTLQNQYARWRQMEVFKRVDDARPRCARVSEPF